MYKLFYSISIIEKVFFQFTRADLRQPTGNGPAGKE